MSNLEIRKETDGRHGRYVGTMAGVEGEAQIVFTQRGPHLVSADHTEAPPAMRGTGAARALVAYMVADARQNGFKIIPVCPFVKAQAGKHPEWADVIAAAPG